MKLKNITIEKLVSGGYGLGRIDGRVVLVPYSAPGDEVLVEDAPARRGVSWGNIREIVSPSHSRVSPSCAHYTYCGGCQLQHIAYADQLECKRLIVQDALTRIGGITGIDVNPCLGSPMNVGHRSRVRLHCHNGEIGFHKARSNAIDAIESCPMLSGGINNHLKQLASYLSSHSIKGLAEVEMMEDSDSRVVLALHMEDSFPGAGVVQGLRQNVSAFGAVATLKRRTKHLWGEKASTILIDGIKFQISPNAFFQANISLLPALIRQVLQTIKSTNSEMGLELYAGVGLFSIVLSEKARRLVAVEWNQDAAEDARANLKANQIRNVDVITLSAEKALDMLLSKDVRPELIVLDPPREGLSNAVCSKLLQMTPQQIIYVSCNPATLARDIKSLSASGAYAAEKITPLDMFPHTSHIECVCSLLRKA
jgi:23S rRNA (uracil1939-C5)-methyltransferase